MSYETKTVIPPEEAAFYVYPFKDALTTTDSTIRRRVGDSNPRSLSASLGLANRPFTTQATLQQRKT